MPATLQSIGWAVRPTALMREAERRFGEIFTLRINGRKGMPYVFVSNPDASRRSPPADRDALRAGAARGFDLFEPVFGPNSILVLDGADPPAPAQADAAAVPRRAHEELRRPDRGDHRAGWPVANDVPFELQAEFARSRWTSSCGPCSASTPAGDGRRARRTASGSRPWRPRSAWSVPAQARSAASLEPASTTSAPVDALLYDADRRAPGRPASPTEWTSCRC